MRIRVLHFLRRYHISAFVILLLVVALVLMSLRVKQRRGVAWLDGLLIEFCSPFQRAATVFMNTIQGTLQQYLLLVNLHKENEMLHRKVEELQRENHRLEELALANERLMRLIQFRENIASSTVAAEVIGQDSSAWFKSFTINKGERDGVRRGMAVVSPGGVVGQILKTSVHYATVLLVTDYNSAIDAIVQRTRAKAIVEGMGGNRCQLKYLLRSEDVVMGDVVVTSGLGGNFPKGLRVGEIRNVEKKGHGVFQYAEITPSADLSRLEEVLVITGSPAPAQEEKERKAKKPPAGGPKGR